MFASQARRKSQVFQESVEIIEHTDYRDCFVLFICILTSDNYRKDVYSESNVQNIFTIVY
uniref:Uncharacterized protein n=1 Tax=Arion vulgaris TaxID=1028688 RepID=A0A0B6ZPB2_9EUPU